MKTLLIPTDFSETSEAAVDFGLQLAEHHGYDVILHHTVDFVQTYDSMYMDAPNIHSLTEEVVEDCEVRLENLLRKCDRNILTISKSLTIGNMIADIRKVVGEREVDLIVMGTKGASGMKEFFVGSNTEKVVRLVDCPVISIPGSLKVADIRKILVPVDLREVRPSFLRQISKFQQLFSASVDFLWVKTPHTIENSDLVTEEFNALLGEYEIASSSFTIVHDVFPVEGILAYAKDTEADMIAMATHARRGLSHLFSGSLTEDVMNHTESPMWSFKLDKNEEKIDFDSSLINEIKAKV